MSYAIKLAAIGVAFLVVGLIAIWIFNAFWFRVGFGAAIAIFCGGMLYFAWRVDKKERAARAGLEDLPNV